VEDPAIAHVRLSGPGEDVPQALRGRIREIVAEELGRLPQLQKELVDGTVSVDRWPLRA
jgi:hypothetical protein